MTLHPPPPIPESPAPRPSGHRATFAALACVAALGAIGVATVAIVGGDGGEAIVLEIDDAVAAEPPVTIPPVSIETVPPSPASSDDGAGTTDDQGASSPTDYSGDDSGDDGRELSPLADLLGPRYSAIPEEIEPRPQPVGIRTDSIDIERFPIRAVGLEDDGQLEVPDETEIGWYRYGATAGRPGATVLAAHVSWNDTTGPFFRLGTMEPGDRVTVALDDGSSRVYEVTERTMYDKNALPRDRIWRNTGPETLVLITCGGDFNPDIRRYRQNIVVYAVPVEATPPTRAT